MNLLSPFPFSFVATHLRFKSNHTRVVNLLLSIFLFMVMGNSYAEENKGLSRVMDGSHSIDNKGLSRIVVKDQDGHTITAYENSYALLIGMSNYRQGWSDLSSVPAELQQVKEVLQKVGFKVVAHVDLDLDAFKRTMTDFINAYGYDSKNRLLVYYSGHGYSRQNGTKGYLVTVDAPNPLVDERKFLHHSLPMKQFEVWSSQMEANHVLFLFDSCFSGTIFKTRGTGTETPNYIDQLTAKKVRQFITAGSAGEEVPSKSVFTPAFVDALKYGLGDLNNDGYITGSELGVHLQAQIPRHTPQTPQFGKIGDYENDKR